MSADLEFGNANDAGAAYRGWMIGDLHAWSLSTDHAGPLITPRQSKQLQVKWFTHPPNDERVSWTAFDESWSLSVVIAGDLTIEFESRDGEYTSVVLHKQGDYAIWNGATYRHSWSSQAGATILTIRWPRS